MRQLHFIFFILVLLIPSYGHTSTVILQDITGKSIPFKSLKGKWVFINYWASWCQSCIDEVAELNRFYKNHNSQVALFAVNYDALPVASQVALIEKYKIHYPSLRKDPARELKLGDIRGVPATFIFNPEGHLVETLYGGQTLKSLKQAIA